MLASGVTFVTSTCVVGGLSYQWHLDHRSLDQHVRCGECVAAQSWPHPPVCVCAGGIDAATAAAKAADVVVLALGLDEGIEGESHDRTTTALPDPQVGIMPRREYPQWEAFHRYSGPVQQLEIESGMMVFYSILRCTWYRRRLNGDSDRFSHGHKSTVH